MHGVAHVARWEPCDLHDLANVSRLRCVLWTRHTDSAQHLIVADTGRTVGDLQ